MKKIAPLTVLLGSLASVASNASPGLNIALTNDDGWSTYGIHALFNALGKAGHTVTLAGPYSGESGSSASINMDPLVIKKHGEGIYSVATEKGSAEPATSGMIALDIAGQRGKGAPDLLISGINDGANIGPATQVSGTVGAAIVAMGRMLGDSVPAIAISTDKRCRFKEAESPEDAVIPDPNDIPAACSEIADYVVALVDKLAAAPAFAKGEAPLLPAGLGLNINYPPVEPRGERIASQGRLLYIGQLGGSISLSLACEGDCVNMPVGATASSTRVNGGLVKEADVANSDSTLYAEGYITIVPIEADYTARPAASAGLVEQLQQLIAAPAR
ncbi:5'/3'-nucleotidase SurE [Haliea sp. E17]|uniref:5'/3'-nucleotidase SurE n=1 Tax=Haliea sp. E17 TaxID=3401576 RepID=UPI003AAF2630